MSFRVKTPTHSNLIDAESSICVVDPCSVIKTERIPSFQNVDYQSSSTITNNIREREKVSNSQSENFERNFSKHYSMQFNC